MIMSTPPAPPVTVEVCQITSGSGTTIGTLSLPCADPSGNGITLKFADGSSQHLNPGEYTFKWNGQTIMYTVIDSFG